MAANLTLEPIGQTVPSFASTTLWSWAEVDDPGCSKLTFELKGCYKKDPAKEVVLGSTAIETKKKAKTYVLDLAPSTQNASFFGGGSDERANSICKLSITLYHNRFPVDLSPDEVALRHKREMLASKELKHTTKPSAREYSFLLNRKMNWDMKDAASFNNETEKQLDKDVVTNLKEMYNNKQKEKALARRTLPAAGKNFALLSRTPSHHWHMALTSIRRLHLSTFHHIVLLL